MGVNGFLIIGHLGWQSSFVDELSLDLFELSRKGVGVSAPFTMWVNQ